MLAKNNSVQQQQSRRAPLSLSTSMKPTKSNDNNKKETTTNNQKTDNNSKKDSLQERKLSADKKQSSTDSKRSSSTSSTESSKKLEANKINNKNDDNKKSQNGVNGNNLKDKANNTTTSNEATAKTKPEPSSNGNASKSLADKKNNPVVDVVASAKNDTKEKPTTQKTQETKNEENKDKATEKNKEKTAEVSNSKQNQEKSSPSIKEKNAETNAEAEATVDKKKNDEKVIEEKNATIQSAEKTNVIDQEVVMSVSESNEQNSPATQTPKKNEETKVLTTQINIEKKEELETPIVENPQANDLLEDVMMEPLEFTEEPTCNIFAVSTPPKSCSPKEAQNLFEMPSKMSPKSEVKPSSAQLQHTPDRKSCPRTFSAISGRRSIRPIGDYTFSGNLQIRESYRKINTELDFTTSSLNVTVGSEVPNNESFSFFSRSRKRDRSSPTPQAAMEVQSELSPKSPKRPRIDMSGLFNAMASPITMLRARLARASVQSTPKRQIVDSIEQEIVENVSAIAVEAVEEEEVTATEEQTFNPDSTVADTNEPCEEEPSKSSQSPAVLGDDGDDDIKIKEYITATDSQAKKKCSIM